MASRRTRAFSSSTAWSSDDTSSGGAVRGQTASGPSSNAAIATADFRCSITWPIIFFDFTSWSGRKNDSSASIASSWISSMGSSTSGAIGPIASGYRASRRSLMAASRVLGSGLRRFRMTSSNRSCWAEAAVASASRPTARIGGLMLSPLSADGAGFFRPELSPQASWRTRSIGRSRERPADTDPYTTRRSARSARACRSPRCGRPPRRPRGRDPRSSRPS